MKRLSTGQMAENEPKHCRCCRRPFPPKRVGALFFFKYFRCSTLTFGSWCRDGWELERLAHTSTDIQISVQIPAIRHYPKLAQSCDTKLRRQHHKVEKWWSGNSGMGDQSDRNTHLRFDLRPMQWSACRRSFYSHVSDRTSLQEMPRTANRTGNRCRQSICDG